MKDDIYVPYLLYANIWSIMTIVVTTWKKFETSKQPLNICNSSALYKCNPEKKSTTAENKIRLFPRQHEGHI